MTRSAKTKAKPRSSRRRMPPAKPAPPDNIVLHRHRQIIHDLLAMIGRLGVTRRS